MAQKSVPTAAIVIAIFHFIGGSCCLFGSVASMSGFQDKMTEMVAKADPKQAQMQRELKQKMEELPGFKTYSIVSAGITMTMAILLLLAGIGLLTLQPYGRMLSIVFAIIMIIFTIINIAYQAMYVLPVTKEAVKVLIKDQKDPKMAEAMEMGATIGGGIGVFVGGCINLLYPIIVLIVMNLASVKRAFAPGYAGIGGEGLREMDGEDRDRTRRRDDF